MRDFLMHAEGHIPIGRVVRSEEAHVTPLYPPSRLLRSGEAEAARLLEEAKAERAAAAREAAELVAAAKSEAGAIRERAAREGATESAERLTALLGAAREEIGKFRDGAAEQVVRLALRLARAIVDVEFVAKPERVGELAVKGLRHAGFSERVRVLMHPEDAALVGMHAPEMARAAGYEGALAVEADESVGRGMVRVVTEMGEYEAGVESQFEELRRAVLGKSGHG